MKIVNRTRGQITLRFDSTIDANGALIIETIDIGLGAGTATSTSSAPGAFANQQESGVPLGAVIIPAHGQTGLEDGDGAASDNVLHLLPNNPTEAAQLAGDLYDAIQAANPSAVAGPRP